MRYPVFQIGEPATKLYTVIAGDLRYQPSHDDDEEAAIALEPECFICESVLWVHWSHSGLLSTTNNAELACVDSADFRKVVHRNSSLTTACRSYAKRFRDLMTAAL